jgi:hypothetical protein
MRLFCPSSVCARVQLYQSGRLALTRLLEAGAGILTQSRRINADRRRLISSGKRDLLYVIRASDGVVYFVKGRATTRTNMQARQANS